MWELKNRFTALLLAFLILMAGSAACSATGSATRIIVHSDESIQAAVDSASNGSVIILEPGTYNQNVTISTEGIIFRSSTGNPDDVIIQDEDEYGTIVYLTNDAWGATFKGITFKNSGVYGTGIFNDRSGDTMITNCKFINGGISIGGVSTVYISRNMFVNCEWAIGVGEFASIYGRDNTFIDCGTMVSYNEEFYPLATELENSTEIHSENKQPAENPVEPDVPVTNPPETPIEPAPVTTPTETPVETPTEAPIEDTGSSSGGSHHSSSSGGSGGAGGSPEPANNVQAKDTTKVFIPNGKQVCFNFTNDVTVVESISFTSKKTMGKTTAIVEDLKKKSTLVSDLPEGEVYRSFNVWVGNAGYGNSDNILNAAVEFKVEKSWMQENNVGQSSIVLYKYNDESKKWTELPVTLTGEDDDYLYFTAETPGYYSFVITGEKEISTEPTATFKGSVVNDSESADVPESAEDTKAPGFGMISGVICLIGVFLYRRR